MRYETPIYFRRVKPGDYNPVSGDYDVDTVTEVKRYASVTDSNTQTMMLVYGALKQGSLTIRLQQHYTEPFDNIRVGDKVYSVDLERRLRTAHTFVLSEVQ